MLLGIDVGGTFTDAVIIDKQQISAQIKVPTRHEDIFACIVEALDKVLTAVDVKQIKRVVISSTIVTNALTENKVDPVFLAVMTGPGMNVKHKFPVEPYLFSGYIDHRGKVVSQIQWAKHQDILSRRGRGVCAVSGKFAVREPQNEYLLKNELLKSGYKKVFLGSELSGELNFIRRTNSAYFSAAVYNVFEKFCQKVEQALKNRNISAPVHILKADGGTLPLDMALNQPVETIFTGPAASVLGIEALMAIDKNSISLDIGGTTTDIAFWESGLPLMAKKGAAVNGYPTAVRAFHMRSVGIGGDSKISKTDFGYQVGPEREGPAAAVGGNSATLSDALIIAGYINFGDAEKSRKALSIFGEDVTGEAEKIIAAAVKTICDAIEDMLEKWRCQPVYTVNDVICGTDFKPQEIIGVGGGSLGLVKAVADKLKLPYRIPQGAMVANAVGAALAKPTLSAGLRADTTEGYYIIPESGVKKSLPRKFNQQEAEKILMAWLQQQAEKWQIPVSEIELISYEHFRTIHGYYDTGDIYSLRMQLKPGILYKVTGREVIL